MKQYKVKLTIKGQKVNINKGSIMSDEALTKILGDARVKVLLQAKNCPFEEITDDEGQRAAVAVRKAKKADENGKDE